MLRTVSHSSTLFPRDVLHVTCNPVYLAYKRPKSVFGFPLIHPASVYATAWTAFMLLVDLTYTAFWVPIDVAFCSLSFGDISDSLTQVEIAGGNLKKNLFVSPSSYCFNLIPCHMQPLPTHLRLRLLAQHAAVIPDRNCSHK